MFEELKATVDFLLIIFSTDATKGHMTALASLIGVWLSFTVLYKGYMILAGKIQDPIRDLIWDMIIKMIIVTFAFHAHGWIALVDSSINGLVEWAGGGNTDGVFAKLDAMYKDVKDIDGKMSSLDGYLEFKGWFAGLIVVISFLAVASFGSLIVLLTTLTLKILIMLSPLMIISLIFPILKQIFSKWFELVLNNVLTVLIVGVALETLADKYKLLIDELVRNDTLQDNNVMSLALDFVVPSILVFFLIYLAKTIAQQITYVSIEGVAPSLLKSGASGAGRGAKSLYNSTPTVTAEGIRR